MGNRINNHIAYHIMYHDRYCKICKTYCAEYIHTDFKEHLLIFNYYCKTVHFINFHFSKLINHIDIIIRNVRTDMEVSIETNGLESIMYFANAFSILLFLSGKYNT